MVLTEWDRLAGHEKVIEERVVTWVEELLELDLLSQSPVTASPTPSWAATRRQRPPGALAWTWWRCCQSTISRTNGDPGRKAPGRRSPRLRCSRWPRRARCFRPRPPDK